MVLMIILLDFLYRWLWDVRTLLFLLSQSVYFFILFCLVLFRLLVLPKTHCLELPIYHGRSLGLVKASPEGGPCREQNTPTCIFQNGYISLSPAGKKHKAIFFLSYSLSRPGTSFENWTHKNLYPNRISCLGASEDFTFSIQSFQQLVTYSTCFLIPDFVPVNKSCSVKLCFSVSACLSLHFGGLGSGLPCDFTFLII